MAYDETKLTKLGALKALAEKVADNYATKADLQAEISTLDTRIDDIVSTGGEPNVLTTVKVNGSALTITDKAVDITVPTKVSDLTNDSEYQTATEVASTVADEIAKVVAEAPESLDTLKEIADWISEHADSAATMNSSINANATAIAALETLVGSLPEDAWADTIGEYLQIIQDALEEFEDAFGDYATTANVDAKLANYYTSAQVDTALASYVFATDDEVSELLAEIFD